MQNSALLEKGRHLFPLLRGLSEPTSNILKNIT